MPPDPMIPSQTPSYGIVSIITPVYNGEKFIAETIRSVRNQTYQHWEMIVVDDGSSDNTRQIVLSFQKEDERIRYISNDVNKGSACSRNIALRNAKGRWIAFLDSDDIWHPEKLERQVEFMLKNDCRFSYTNYCEIDENSEETGVLMTGPEAINKNKMLAYCWPGCLTVMYDAEYVGLMQTDDIMINEEYALWIKIARKTECRLLDENLAKYRRRYGSLSRQSYCTLIKWHYLMFRRAEGKDVFSSLFLTLGNLVFGVYKKIVYRKSY